MDIKHTVETEVKVIKTDHYVFTLTKQEAADLRSLLFVAAESGSTQDGHRKVANTMFDEVHDVVGNSFNAPPSWLDLPS